MQFVATFRDGRKLFATARSSTVMEMQAAMHKHEQRRAQGLPESTWWEDWNTLLGYVVLISFVGIVVPGAMVVALPLLLIILACSLGPSLWQRRQEPAVQVFAIAAAVFIVGLWLFK
jgi:uncharacterized membrane protein